MAEANLEKLTKAAVDAALDFKYEGQTIREWVQDIAEANHVGKWIPVSMEIPEEELPEDFQRVLITVVNYAGYKVVRAACYINPRRMFRVEGSSDLWEVGEKGLLAWMPLPEPYKAESEKEKE